MVTDCGRRNINGRPRLWSEGPGTLMESLTPEGVSYRKGLSLNE